jgi:hypothetical protein
VSCVACPSCACVAAPRPFRMPCQSDRHTHDHDHDHDARPYNNTRKPSIAICCSSSSRGRAARGNCLLTGAITHSPFLDVGARSRAKQWDCGVQRADAENGGFIMRSAAGWLRAGELYGRPTPQLPTATGPRPEYPLPCLALPCPSSPSPHSSALALGCGLLPSLLTLRESAVGLAMSPRCNSSDRPRLRSTAAPYGPVRYRLRPNLNPSSSRSTS